MRKRAGFTLIELLVVCALIAMLAGIGFLYYKRYEWSTISGTTATQLATHMMIARTTSAKAGADYLFTFYPSSYQYSMCKASPSSSTCAALPRFYKLPKGMKFGRLSGVSHAPDLGCSTPPSGTSGVIINCVAYSGNASFRYNMDGTIANGGVMIYLVPSNPDGAKTENQRAISIGQMSGQVRIWKYYPKGYWK